MGCEVLIGGGGGVPNVAEGLTYWGYEIGKVRASLGFEIRARRREGRPEKLHSIFLNTEFLSAPINRFGRLKRNSPQSRQIENMYR